jgi:hypothetical protein
VYIKQLWIYRRRYQACNMHKVDDVTMHRNMILHLFIVLTATWWCNGTIPWSNSVIAFVPISYHQNKLYHRHKIHPARINFLSETALHMGRKITIRIVGRKQGSEDWLEDACDMYLQRLKPTGFEVITEWYKNNEALLKIHNEQHATTTSNHNSNKNIPIVLLDPNGIRCTSESFTDHIYEWLQIGGSRLVFVIGGGT